MTTATIISISAIQVACPECGSLCKSASPYEEHDSPITSTEVMPFITMSQDGFPVVCLRCGKQWSLPDAAFRIFGE